MINVLIVDSTPYKDELTEIFKNSRFHIDSCSTAFDAIAKLKYGNFDLIISEVELPGDNAFELYYFVKKTYPYLPIIMVTNKDIDLFFDKIIDEGIGNVVTKPVNRDEIIKLAAKLIGDDNLFGLEFYISGLLEHKKIRINNSTQIQNAINTIFDHIEQWGMTISNKTMLNLLLNEMIINAVYHSHGLTQAKLERKPVKLPEGKFVDIYFGLNEGQIGICVTDYNGKLSKSKILESIHKLISQRKYLHEAMANGVDISNLVSETGRGIDLVTKLANEYYFVIHKDVRTDIIFIFNKEMELNNSSLASLKIIEFDE